LLIDLYPLTRNSRFAQIPTSPRKRGEVEEELAQLLRINALREHRP
jgi:hypothetical protein